MNLLSHKSNNVKVKRKSKQNLKKTRNDLFRHPLMLFPLLTVRFAIIRPNTFELSLTFVADERKKTNKSHNT